MNSVVTDLNSNIIDEMAYTADDVVDMLELIEDEILKNAPLKSCIGSEKEFYARSYVFGRRSDYLKAMTSATLKMMREVNTMLHTLSEQAQK